MGNVENPTKVSQGTMLTIEEQYKKVSKNNSLKKSLTLSELFQIKTLQNHPFSFHHIGVLFVCDKQLDCLFSLSDMIEFTKWIQDRLYGVPSYQFKSQLQTQALDDLIKFILVPENQKKIRDWVVGMLMKDQLPPHHEGYIKISQLKLMYDMFNVKTMNNIDYQYFINLIRKAAEEMGYQIVEAFENQELQEYVSVIVCSHFTKYFLQGIKKIVKEIGFDKPVG